MAGTNDATPPADWHYLGKLGRAFQLTGGLRFYPAGELEADAVTRLGRVFVTGLGEARVREVRPHGGDLVVWLSRARTREQAQALANAEVYADPVDLPEAPEDAFYLDDLLGVSAVLMNDSGSSPAVDLGEVVDVLATAGQDLLVVAGPRGQVLLPLQAPYVEFDGVRVLVIDPPEGLLDASG